MYRRALINLFLLTSLRPDLVPKLPYSEDQIKNEDRIQISKSLNFFQNMTSKRKNQEIQAFFSKKTRRGDETLQSQSLLEETAEMEESNLELEDEDGVATTSLTSTPAPVVKNKRGRPAGIKNKKEKEQEENQDDFSNIQSFAQLAAFIAPMKTDIATTRQLLDREILNNKKFQKKATRDIETNKLSISENSKKIANIDAKLKADKRETNNSIENLKKEVASLKEVGVKMNGPQAQELLEQYGLKCELFNRSVGLCPVGPAQLGPMKEFLETKWNVEVNQQNIVPLGVRSYYLNDMNMKISDVHYFEFNTDTIEHDGDETAYVTFRNDLVATQLFGKAKGFAEGCAKMGLARRKLKLRIVPELSANWKFMDHLGYTLRQEARTSQPPYFFSSRIVMIRDPNVTGDYTYSLEVKYNREDKHMRYRIPAHMVVPGVDLGQRELPMTLHDPLHWDDYNPGMLREEIRAGVEQVRDEYKEHVVHGRIRIKAATLRLWQAVMGKGNDDHGQDEDYWLSFDPTFQAHLQPDQLPVPPEHPQFSELHWELSCRNIEDRFKRKEITVEQFEDLRDQLAVRVCNRPDAQSFMARIENMVVRREEEANLQPDAEKEKDESLEGSFETPPESVDVPVQQTLEPIPEGGETVNNGAEGAKAEDGGGATGLAAGQSVTINKTPQVKEKSSTAGNTPHRHNQK